ncbi:hypothetical protein [Sulfuriferula multivorans]|uniref:hypothetical protein n=1 Tax=Sulfuriferula multivorans TaxID=1559896 RepID=UPI000F5B948C|nr:hypothetical protein [Sulfuriferula multivorans]
MNSWNDDSGLSLLAATEGKNLPASTMPVKLVFAPVYTIINAVIWCPPQVIHCVPDTPLIAWTGLEKITRAVKGKAALPVV